MSHYTEVRNIQLNYGDTKVLTFLFYFTPNFMICLVLLELRNVFVFNKMDKCGRDSRSEGTDPLIIKK